MCRGHQISTHGLHVSKFTVPFGSQWNVTQSGHMCCTGCTLQSLSRANWRALGMLTFAQQKTGPAERLSFGSGESWPELFSKESSFTYWNTIHGMRSSRIWYTTQTNGGTGVSGDHHLNLSPDAWPPYTWHPWSLWARPMLYQISLLHRSSGLCQMEVV